MAASKESRNTAREKLRFEVLSAATKELSMSVNSFRRSLLIAFLSTFLAWPIQGSAVHAAEVTVFAAASLKNALDDVAKAYEA